MSRLVSHRGVQVRLAAGQTLTSTMKARIDQGIGDRSIKSSGQCVVFFPRRGDGRGEPIQRCENRSLSTSAKDRWRQMRRRGSVCIRNTKEGPRFSNRCSR